ncbi:MAG: sulfatase [Prosthecobacter sp.]|uniref:sulfatase family protein n=1 Tax=Prosthecobacter sp. TaxID=1965333 RepID=UPI0025DB88B3|nr:sulfatase [Prosthecobacter sp.]MCF7785541.1 sulfatase [Prosthecobacter sp.]
MKLLLSAVLAALAFVSSIRAEDAPRPNILFVIFDDWGWQHAGAYGCDWVKTPNFDRVAKEGVLFKNAFTSNPKCSPCRATILTGRNSWQLEEAVCHGGIFPPKFAVYPDLLEASGYNVGLTGKGWGPGDFKLNGRTRNPAGPSFDTERTKPPTTGINKNDYSANFSKFLGQRDAKKPFCFWMGFTEPHRPYELNSGERLGKNLVDVDVPGYFPDNATVRGDMADYAIEVENADAHIGRALAMLEKEGILEDTLVIVTSDHGMPFPRVKGQIYEDGFHLPLAMRWGKGIKPGRVVEDFINVRDFAPTYLELAGLPKHEQISGSSLVKILSSEKSGFIEDRKTMLVGKERHDIGRPNDWGYPVRAIRTPEFFYSHNYHAERWPAGNPETGYRNCDDSPTKAWIIENKGAYYELAFAYRAEEELYDMVHDTECLRNLAADPKYAATKKELREKMESRLKEEKDPRALGNEAIFDTYKYLGNRKNKGYAEWEAAQKGQPLPEVPKKKGKKDADE